jgi:hypothetical protein
VVKEKDGGKKEIRAISGSNGLGIDVSGIINQ